MKAPVSPLDYTRGRAVVRHNSFGVPFIACCYCGSEVYGPLLQGHEARCRQIIETFGGLEGLVDYYLAREGTMRQIAERFPGVGIATIRALLIIGGVDEETLTAMKLVPRPEARPRKPAIVVVGTDRCKLCLILLGAAGVPSSDVEQVCGWCAEGR